MYFEDPMIWYWTKKTAFFCVLMFGPAFLQAQDCVGWWKFDDSVQVLAAEPGYGNALSLIGSHSFIAGPDSGNGGVRVPVGSYYELQHGILPNGGGNLVNHYTLRFDFRVKNPSIWHCFFQTDTTNASDGDCFINTAGNIGVAQTGYGSSSIISDEWYRLLITVDMENSYRYYLDGKLLLEGSVQTLDGRFALLPWLILFGDNNSEDGEIDIAEIMIWDRALSETEVHDLGGFEHFPKLIVSRIPYLQSATANSISISWHDSSSTVTGVEFGTTVSLGQWQAAESEAIDATHLWHTAQLTGLQPFTEYNYRCVSASGETPMYQFRTAPDSSYKGHLRFLILGDNRTDSARFAWIIRSAQAKVEELYGADLHNQIQLVANVGDIVSTGNVVSQYLREYFLPMAPFSPYVPSMISIGNHEGEALAYYKYMKYEDFSPYKSPDVSAEKYYSFNMANTHFVFLNANINATLRAIQSSWLASDLALAEDNPSTDFTFAFIHHPGHSEIWPDGNTAYTQNEVLPLLQSFPKVQQLAYGHSHNYERGVFPSTAPNTIGDLRLLLSGGGGSVLDRWGMYANQRDYPEIHASYDHYCYVIIDIDIRDKSYTGTMYSLGNTDKSLDAVALDTWHRKLNQPAPEQPQCTATRISGDTISLQLSPFTGMDSVMSLQFQVSETPGNFSVSVLDSTHHWQNIYGADSAYNPVDLNAGIDMSEMNVVLPDSKLYAVRGRYRDRNLRWSPWSHEEILAATSIQNSSSSIEDRLFTLGDVYPNPFNPTATIEYYMARTSHVRIVVLDILGRNVKVLVDDLKSTGSYTVAFDASRLPSGTYLCKMQAGAFVTTKTMLVSR
jgi:purple acid phosphatase-like protein/type IX secretion system substrate protein/calcineurin-like phosphoesterase family protein/concanavalin A-like lectin/glucanase superfamily protein